MEAQPEGGASGEKVSGPGEGAWQPRDPKSGTGRGLTQGLGHRQPQRRAGQGEAEGPSPGHQGSDTAHCDTQTTEALVCLHVATRHL